MIIKKCKNCGIEFRARRQTTCYCSKECMRQFVPKLISNARKGMKFTEEHKANLRKNHTRPMLGKKFSKEHREKIRLAKLGNKNPNWKGGKYIDSGGYILVMEKSHPRADKDGHIQEHILVAEKKIGRFINLPEVIHHINRIKTDNHPKNLYLFSNASEHRKCHLHNWILTSNII